MNFKNLMFKKKSNQLLLKKFLNLIFIFKDFLSKYGQIHNCLGIWSHLEKRLYSVAIKVR